MRSATLTKREHEVLELAATTSLSNKELALKMGLEAGTVKNFLHMIYGKLGLFRESSVDPVVPRTAQEGGGTMKTAMTYVAALGVQDAVMFVLGGLFGGRIYGVAKRLAGHAESVIGHLAGKAAGK